MIASCNSNELIKRVGYEKAFEVFNKAGIECMDFPVDGIVRTVEDLSRTNTYGLTEDEVFDKYSKLREVACKNNVKIGQTHSIFGRFAPCDTEEFVQLTKNNIAATAALGCDCTVIHAIRYEDRLFDLRKEDCFAYNMQFYAKLVPTLEKYHVKAAVENGIKKGADGLYHKTECADPYDILEYMQELGTENFCLCIDSGHFSLTEKDTGYSIEDCIRILAPYTKLVHLHETDLIHDSHTIPFAFGTMNWDSILRTLIGTGYSGTINFEIMSFLKPFPAELTQDAMNHIGNVIRFLAGRAESFKKTSI